MITAFSGRLLRFAAASMSAAAVLAFTSPAAAATDVPATSHYRITLEMDECATMYLGTQGTCIVSLQTWMRWATGRDLDVNGYYDQDTLAAVQSFQRTFRIKPTGHFGKHSRAALAKWWVLAGGGDGKQPCDMSTGDNCDKGVAESGINGGLVQTVLCEVVGKAPRVGEGAGVFCDVFLE